MSFTGELLPSHFTVMLVCTVDVIERLSRLYDEQGFTCTLTDIFLVLLAYVNDGYALSMTYKLIVYEPKAIDPPRSPIVNVVGLLILSRFIVAPLKLPVPYTLHSYVRVQVDKFVALVGSTTKGEPGLLTLSS